MKTEAERLIPRPTRRAYLAYYGVGTLLALIIIGGSRLLGATKAQMIVAGIIFLALYIAIALPLLLREQWRRRLPKTP